MPPKPSQHPRRERSFSRPSQKWLPAILWTLLWLLPVGSARAVDVLYYEMFKGQLYTQSGTASPVLAASNPYVFQITLIPSYLPYVTNPVVKNPSGISSPARVQPPNQLHVWLP